MAQSTPEAATLSPFTELSLPSLGLERIDPFELSGEASSETRSRLPTRSVVLLSPPRRDRESASRGGRGGGEPGGGGGIEGDEGGGMRTWLRGRMGRDGDKQAMEKRQNLAAFWALGLLNNVVYVIMLAGAKGMYQRADRCG